MLIISDKSADALMITNGTLYYNDLFRCEYNSSTHPEMIGNVRWLRIQQQPLFFGTDPLCFWDRALGV